jgi:predicted ATP-dependent serine protease
VQKQIARYEKISQDVVYDDFQDLTNQKAISLESLKSKKFKTLPFSDKWKDLIGTPEANFCMMVYGKPGQGKSYFTLELSEYLASKFGTILFNSSEEGSSLSLQNKIANFNMENIYLGDAKDINSLQLFLTQSPYKFVVIDSINHINITPEDLRKLRGLHPTKAFICILQSTKSGDFKGSNEYEHDADISIKIDNKKAECMKTRYK